MAGIAEVVAHAPGAVFAVDEDLRITAWNRAAEQGVGLPADVVLGTPCYETFGAVDADTGEPCFERCPLVRTSSAYGWVHSRVLKARWQGDTPVNLDCILLQCVLPSSERATLGFITPLGPADAKRHLRAMSAMETLYPVLSRSTDLPSSLGTALEAVLQATETAVAKLIVLDSETSEPFEVVRRAAEAGVEAEIEHWLDRIDAPVMGARAEDALVAFQLPADSQDGTTLRWCLTVPLLAEERLMGVLIVASQRADFDFGFAARVLFAVSGQLSVFLRWALFRARPGASAPASVPDLPTLRFHCFRRFRVMREGHEIPRSRFRRQKSLTLLKLLVGHRGRPLHREAIVDHLWPEADPVLASNNLRVVLHDLRRALEPDLQRGRPSSFIVTHGDLVYLDISDRCWSDVEEFERLAKQFDVLIARGQVEAALETAQQAMRLYAVEYMPDEIYSDWCISEQERLREVYVRLLQRAADAYGERQQHDKAIEVCRLALVADPLREEVHRRLIGLLWKAGQGDEALRQYETWRRMLWQDLEVSPDQETDSLYRAILEQRKRPTGSTAGAAPSA